MEVTFGQVYVKELTGPTFIINLVKTLTISSLSLAMLLVTVGKNKPANQTFS